MKKLARLFKKIVKSLQHTFYTPASDTKKKHPATELGKAWYTNLKDKESKTPVSDQQRKLLYQFMHFHKENDLN